MERHDDRPPWHDDCGWHEDHEGEPGGVTVIVHNHRPDHGAILRQIQEDIEAMSASTDRLTAAVDANTSKVDELIAKFPGDGAALAEAEAAMNATSDKLDVTNGKIDGVLNPPTPGV